MRTCGDVCVCVLLPLVVKPPVVVPTPILPIAPMICGGSRMEMAPPVPPPPGPPIPPSPTGPVLATCSNCAVALIRVPPPALRMAIVPERWSAVTPHWSLASMMMGLSGNGQRLAQHLRQVDHHETGFGERIDHAAIGGDDHFAHQVLGELNA